MARAATNTAARKLFFARLAETANVSLSAREAGLHSREIYALRRSDPAFREEWRAALTEGYVRIEAELVADALRAVPSNITEKTMKLRAEKQKIRMFLHTAHRQQVRGPTVAKPAARESPAQIRKRIDAKFVEMRKRLEEADATGK